MIAITPLSAHTLWVLADTSRTALEVLGITAAVVGVLLWVAGLAWFVLSDISRATHHKHHDADARHDSGRSGRSGR